jgi:hypothetical protein
MRVGDLEFGWDIGSPDGGACVIAKHNKDGTLTIVHMDYKPPSEDKRRGRD